MSQRSPTQPSLLVSMYVSDGGFVTGRVGCGVGRFVGRGVGLLVVGFEVGLLVGGGPMCYLVFVAHGSGGHVHLDCQ